MVKTKPGQKINVTQLQTTFDKLERLETKPKSELTLRESILFLKDKLTAALKKGYSYQDLSEILSEQEILISAATLKLYLTDISKKSSSRKSRGRSSSSTSSQRSTIVNSSKEVLAAAKSTTGTNRMKPVEVSEQAVKKDSTSSDNSSSLLTNQETIADSQSIDNKPSKTKSKSKVLSDFDDDLSSEFNSF
jgi:hypothetical protein